MHWNNFKKKYLNLENIRRNGESRKTLVWFVVNDESIYVQTLADSSKFKRVHNNESINITPCKMNSTPPASFLAGSQGHFFRNYSDRI